jgi:hypothetical protein
MRIAMALWLFLPLTCQAQNVFTGSCEDFKEHLSQVGVVDLNGKNHPGQDGVTVPHYEIVSMTFSNQKDEPSYQKGYHCFSATVTVVQTVENTSSVLTWIPSPKSCDQCSCSGEINNWQQKLEAHEEAHAHLRDEMIRKMNFDLTDYPVHTCTSVKVSGTSKVVRQQYVKEINDLIAKRQAETEKLSKAMDLVDQTHIPLCADCAACTGNQKPICLTECPSGQLLAGGQCYTPCGPYLTNGTYQNCRFSKTGQPVACCTIPISGQPTYVCSPYNTSICEEQ